MGIYSVVKYLPSMLEALGSIPSTEKKKYTFNNWLKDKRISLSKVTAFIQKGFDHYLAQ
jgi:hypothetical protein